MGCISSSYAVPHEDAAQQPPWDGHIRPIKPWKVDPAITTEQLTRLRNEFWETRVEGQQEMWQALRFAAEAETVRLHFDVIPPPLLLLSFFLSLSSSLPRPLYSVLSLFSLSPPYAPPLPRSVVAARTKPRSTHIGPLLLSAPVSPFILASQPLPPQEELCDQAVNAAGLRPANRRNTLQAMFDERGALYEVPMYALTDPTNLDQAPTQELFKDAARAVADYVHALDRNRRNNARQ